MKFVLLDRDGVINFDSDDYIRSADEWLPRFAETLRLVKPFRWMHAKMRALVEAQGGTIGGIYYCPHLPQDNCNCRKPRTGLLDAVEQDYGCTVAGSVLVGDSMKDIELARRKHCRPVLVRSGNGAKTLASPGSAGDDVRVFDDLAAAAAAILDER